MEIIKLRSFFTEDGGESVGNMADRRRSGLKDMSDNVSMDIFRLKAGNIRDGAEGVSIGADILKNSTMADER